MLKRNVRKVFITSLFLVILFFTVRGGFHTTDTSKKYVPRETKKERYEKNEFREITGSIKKGETLFDIFKRYGLEFSELFKIKEVSAGVHKLGRLYPGRPYKIVVDKDDKLNEFLYWIDDDTILNISKTETGFLAEKVAVDYEKRISRISGKIEDNLITSIGDGKEHLLLALKLSDIYAWDIDFTTDLRRGDVYKIVVEGMYLNGEFKKYGEILSAEFTNNGRNYPAYRFAYEGETDYFDEEGNSVRKAFLKAPLNFRRISSKFSRSRLHPILKIRRPHHGIDYSAPRGTPVSAVGDGMVIFAGYKGQYGRLVKIKHPNGYRTYYGHLSRIGKKIQKGKRVRQGQVIGYVGATGLATGPHLHYEIRINGKAVNPKTIKLPRGKPVPEKLMTAFREFRDSMSRELASIEQPSVTQLIQDEKGEEM